MIDRILAFLALVVVVGGPAALVAIFTGDVVLDFVFFYPLFMSGIWIAGGVYFWLHWERHWDWGSGAAPPPLAGMPMVSVLVPCFNEEDNAAETLGAALAQRYPNIEVIAINDGSRDGTAAVLDALAASDRRLRVIHLARNQGKAIGLQMGAVAARSEYLVCIDGDALLDRDAVSYLVAPLIDNPHVGAVTGNPRIRTRSTLVGRIQVGEFSSIVGLIKRTQRVYGQVFTVSGVVAAFRRRALDDVGYWSPDMITEDIDISWKLQKRHWAIFFEPRALCWILMPETLRGLWKQRLRWAQGGAEVFLKNLRGLWSWRHRRMWLLMAEFCLSTGWAFIFALSILLYGLGRVFDLPLNVRVHTLLPPTFTGMVLTAACLLQFLVSVAIDRRYEPRMERALYWVIWYPLVFWMLCLVTTLVSFPKVMLKTRRERARWVSPRSRHHAHAAMTSPLIHTQRRLLPRVIDALVTLLAWAGFAYLFLVGFIEVLRHRSVADVHLHFSLLWATLDTLGLYLAIGMLNALVLVAWAKYNQFRRQVERCGAIPALQDDELSASFGLSPYLLDALRRHRIVTIHNDEHGRIEAVSAGSVFAPPPSAAPAGPTAAEPVSEPALLEA